MRTASTIEIINNVFHLHISEELNAIRNQFCPSAGHYHCAPQCPVYQTFYSKGMSCNEALDRYPKTCKSLMNIKQTEDEHHDKTKD